MASSVVASASGWTPGYQVPSSTSTWPLPQSSTNGPCGGGHALRARVAGREGVDDAAHVACRRSRTASSGAIVPSSGQS